MYKYLLVKQKTALLQQPTEVSVGYYHDIEFAEQAKLALTEQHERCKQAARAASDIAFELLKQKPKMPDPVQHENAVTKISPMFECQQQTTIVADGRVNLDEYEKQVEKWSNEVLIPALIKCWKDHNAPIPYPQEFTSFCLVDDVKYVVHNLLGR